MLKPVSTGAASGGLAARSGVRALPRGSDGSNELRRAGIESFGGMDAGPEPRIWGRKRTGETRVLLWAEDRVDGVEFHGLLAASGGDDASLAEFVPGVDGEDALSFATGQRQAEIGGGSEAGLHVAQFRFPLRAHGELETRARGVPRARTPTRCEVWDVWEGIRGVNLPGLAGRLGQGGVWIVFGGLLQVGHVHVSSGEVEYLCQRVRGADALASTHAAANQHLPQARLPHRLPQCVQSVPRPLRVTAILLQEVIAAVDLEHQPPADPQVTRMPQRLEPGLDAAIPIRVRRHLKRWVVAELNHETQVLGLGRGHEVGKAAFGKRDVRLSLMAGRVVVPEDREEIHARVGGALDLPVHGLLVIVFPQRRDAFREAQPSVLPPIQL